MTKGAIHSMIYRVSHRTTYEYTEAVSLCHSLAYLQPRDTARQQCLSRRLIVEPEPQVARDWRDYYGNLVHSFTLQKPHRRLMVTALSKVRVEPPTPLHGTLFGQNWEQVCDHVQSGRSREALDALQFVYESPMVRVSETVREFAQPTFTAGRSWFDAMSELTARIFREFKYDPTVTQVATPVEEVLRLRRGVCQDFAHLQIACLRSMGLPARYVSGYLLTHAPPGQSRLLGADASHAWVSVYGMAAGWVDYDPTNNLMPGDKHVTLGWGRDYSEVSPVRGVVLGGGQHRVQVAVDVIPDDE